MELTEDQEGSIALLGNSELLESASETGGVQGMEKSTDLQEGQRREGLQEGPRTKALPGHKHWGLLDGGSVNGVPVTSLELSTSGGV